MPTKLYVYNIKISQYQAYLHIILILKVRFMLSPVFLVPVQKVMLWSHYKKFQRFFSTLKACGRLLKGSGNRIFLFAQYESKLRFLTNHFSKFSL